MGGNSGVGQRVIPVLNDGLDPPMESQAIGLLSCNWMSAISVAVVVTSGERHEGKAGMVLFAGKTV